jgi:hypothetical protein
MNSPNTTSLWKRRIPFSNILSVLSVVCVVIWQIRGRNSTPIPARGGESFQNFATIETPFYWQRDDCRKDETLGGSCESLSKVGCTVCSRSMVLSHYGVNLTPKELNNLLKQNDGYTWRGWLKWNTISNISQNKAAVQGLAKPSYAHIDAALKNGKPVLAKVSINHVIPHWVLIVGKDGIDYPRTAATFMACGLSGCQKVSAKL